MNRCTESERFSSGNQGEAGNLERLSLQPDVSQAENKPLEYRVILL